MAFTEPTLSPSEEEKAAGEITPMASPEFDFWVVNNLPSSPQPALLSADELFSDGVLLPLHLLPSSGGAAATESPSTSAPPPPSDFPSSPASAKINWKYIFKAVDKQRRRERNNSSGSGSGGKAELNINLWPFPRSRSARSGTGNVTRVPGATARRVSSAPCSRSNSRGNELSTTSDKSIIAPPSSSTTSKKGIKIRHGAPVWQLRRFGKVSETKSGGGDKKSEKNSDGDDKVVQSCISYRNPARCGGDDKVEGNERISEGGVFYNLRTLLSKKVY